MWSYSSSSQASPVLRPRVKGNAVIIGKSTVLARRMERLGCWEVEKHHPVALSRLLSMAYGKRISVNDPMVKLLEKAAAALPRNLREADHLISGLPAPLPETERRVEAASRLLKDGVSLSQLEAALRGERLGLRQTPAWAEHLTLCEKGVVLGKGTVIVNLTDLPCGGTAFDLEGKEAEIMALLSVARRGLVPPEMLTKLAVASRALTEGDVARTAIVLAQTGQPALTDEALSKSLTFAANRLRHGMAPLELLKISGLVSRSTSVLPWFKGAGEWNEDAHPREGEGAHYPSRFAPKNGGSADTSADTTNDASGDKATAAKSPYDESKALTVSNVNSYVEAHKGKGRVGDGECVTLVKDATGDHDSAHDTWVAGPLLSADPSNEQAGTVNPADIKPGTAIAIFGPDGRYHNVHAAIFVKYDEDTHEVVVFDQWAHSGGAPAIRRYPFNPPSWKAPMDNAARYSIIQKR